MATIHFMFSTEIICEVFFDWNIYIQDFLSVAIRGTRSYITVFFVMFVKIFITIMQIYRMEKL